MKRTAGIISLAIALLAVVSGCATVHDSESAALQGTWKGREIGKNAPESPRELVISGRHIAYRGAAADDWGKGTFTLRPDAQPKQLVVALTECGIPQYTGKTCLMIYKIEGGWLHAAASEPGRPVAPSGFDVSEGRYMVFQKAN